MIVHLDTSVLVSAFTGSRTLLPTVRGVIGAGHPLGTSAPVMYEWLRGPRVEAELELQRELCPSDQTVAFNATEATVAARIYKVLKRSRGREMDIAIAACAIEHGAAIWTLNTGHFQDIPGVRLYQPKPGTVRSKKS